MYRIAVTNRHLCDGDYLKRIRKLAAGGEYQAILLREKDLTETEYTALAVSVIEICKEYDRKCILHGFPETAKKLYHPFLHLPLPLLAVQSEENLAHFQEIGTSIHSVGQLREAEELGACYVAAGHIFTTDCKKGQAPRGIGFLRDICEKSSVPVYAIGGIHRGNEGQAEAAGAAGVCLMSSAMRED